MKLWLLRPIEGQDHDDRFDWDSSFGFVVRAETENEARAIAQKNGGVECESLGFNKVDRLETWTDPKVTTCACC